MALTLAILFENELYGMRFAQRDEFLFIPAELSWRSVQMTTEDRSLREEEFTSAVEMLQQILPNDELDWLPPSGPATVYTTMVTLWMLILQRLGGGKTLNEVVKDVISHNGNLLPNNKRIREGTLSENSGAYSQARKRLDLETVEIFANRVCDSLIESSAPWFDGRRGFIIDGTTITLAPTEELQEAFPPATNQHGETVWPVAMLMVAHELQSGCALPPEIGAMYGENSTSEAKQAREITTRMPRGSIVLADSGFGIFSVAYHTSASGHDILFRLTPVSTGQVAVQIASPKSDVGQTDRADVDVPFDLGANGERPPNQPRATRRCRTRSHSARGAHRRRHALPSDDSSRVEPAGR